MTDFKATGSLGNIQKIALVIFSLAMAILLLVLRGKYDNKLGYNEISRRSIDPGIALSNNKPSIIEFYADWCEACNEMAPSIVELDRLFGGQVNILLLNVDNNKWDYMIEAYDVKGIPQIDFFNSNGIHLAKSIGIKTKPELFEAATAMLEGKDIPNFSGVQDLRISSLSDTKTKGNSALRKNISPRKHFY